MKPYHKAVDSVTDGILRFFNRAFTKIHIEGPSIDVPTLMDSMVMAVSTHRSHTDYFLFGLILYNMGVKYVRIAAGDNLTSFPVLGKKFRSFGAFSIQRDSAFRRSYVRQLASDVAAMLEDNEPVLLFPEGGRSYRGNMMEIKGGVLVSALIAQTRNPEKSVYLFPAAVSYEHLPELPYFGMLNRGKQMRKKENGFFKRLAGSVLYFGADIAAYLLFYFGGWMGIKHGEAYVDYGSPLRVNDIVDVKAKFQASARDEFSGHQASVRIISNRLHEIFQSLYRLLPEHVVAGMLKERAVLAVREASVALRPLLERLHQQNRNMKSLESLTVEQIIEIGLRQLRHVKAVRVKGGTVAVTKRWIIDYYAAALS
jgi:1-acyl-sn-glycerol-3-phosphate acyltransferase